ncbi:hypothetical protein BATDEDRAFT_87177 [Batrachochytrium dendrobatidis JAM81]|uniref:Peptidase A1 domain-containing protein n=2 Tax=Batrachochytrium dendrobatidis TaxID=109871 RepID=F4NYF3_BATDJ|nr:uncharacterized protein BATDEDRAFT_87177 [Batrachochytrium dendrobatidis JAM81]EGF82009.1 hypothetical protein BATDEDRAFT_87177 [Batrachochytrium dendrobatidis JAM81]OAJ40124.1 hypothetical protein BDEG_23892 [Batrachochytrium dendrobatidis JEL423]|eukprot:XP_006677604.1 hypothetical protein BATDEDRAFT_87177 [Batrachochytrium dendrobatidis JAM81]
MLRLILFLLQEVAAIQIPLLYPSTSHIQSNNRLSKRSPVELDGAVTKCFIMKLNVNGVDLNFIVDSGSSNSIVPLLGLNHYNGPVLKYVPTTEDVLSDSYFDGSFWKGVSFTATVSIPKTSISTTDAPVIGIYQQSTRSLVLNDQWNHGILGIAYPSLTHSKITSGATIIDSFYTSGSIKKNEVAFELCSYELSKQSYIDIGNTGTVSKCGTDGSPVVWVETPILNFLTVNIKSIWINHQKVQLPSTFQYNPSGGITLFSFIDTCAAKILLPRILVMELVNEMIKSRAFQPRPNLQELKLFYFQDYTMKLKEFTIDWKKLPTISFLMSTGTAALQKNPSSIVNITLGPKDYLQKAGPKEYVFAVGIGSDQNAILGISFMTRLRIVLDRKNGLVGFGPGCGCEATTDGYPVIANEHGELWHPSR